MGTRKTSSHTTDPACLQRISAVASGETYRLGDGRSLNCTQTVRFLPGRRQACLAELDEQQVFVKIFLDRKRGKVHWQRELAGIKAFERNGILTAKLLFAGELEETGWPIIVLTRINNPISLKKVWDSAEFVRQETLLNNMVRLLAYHHRVGILQKDLHLENFIISGNEIYSLDGAGVEQSVAEVDRQASLANLALLLAQFDPVWESTIPVAYHFYLTERGWRNNIRDNLLQLVQKARKKRWREVRDKLFRECSAFVAHNKKGRLAIYSRLNDTPELRALLADPDASFPGKQKAIKCGNTCTLWATRVADLSLVIKRYNVKSFWHALKLSTRSGRALISWENAHRLQFNGIATPRPVAILKVRRSLLQPLSYFLTEKVTGRSADTWFQDTAISAVSKRHMCSKVVKLIKQLHDQRIAHGDMKASNFLITEQGPVIIDLDAMRQYRSEISYRNAWRKDLNRFMRNWCDVPELQALFSRALQENGLNNLTKQK